MKLKELTRVLVSNEKDAISIYEEEAELFAAFPKHGAEAAALFARIAEEKRGRIEELGRILKQSSGFRARNTEPSRSVESALRMHVTDEMACVANFVDLLKQMKNSEFKERLSQMLIGTRGHIRALQAMQARIKAEPGK